MEEVAHVCDRAIVLKQGKVYANDLPKNLAKSASFHRLHLTISEGIHKMIEIAQRSQTFFEINEKVVTLSIEEQRIPLFLRQLMQEEISYENIHIKEPTLEDYFLKIAGEEA